MPQQAAVNIDNNFSNGLITEAPTLSFPENALTEVFDCEINTDGTIKRRLGFDFEFNHTTKSIDRTNKVVNTYLWKNVAGDGDVTLEVNQIGKILYFYQTNSSEGSWSQGAIVGTFTLVTVSSAPSAESVEAQFCDGNGFLIVTHPYCDPVRISYDTTLGTISATTITLKIRDFEGATDDPYGITDRPVSTLPGVHSSHTYNLFNQGWSNSKLTTWDAGRTDLPSNADVMWRFKDATGVYDFAAANDLFAAGNTSAPKGHFILTLANQDRQTISGLAAVPSTTSSYQRASATAFFAGRVFYAGINYRGFNSNIYFTQIVERTEQYGYCYQVNDPTSEELFDLLPSDGGVISIPEAGTIYKLFTIPGGLAIHAANGVWFVTGSTGIGFTANDYTVQKISSVPTITASSFTNVQGFPCWWNADGIYMLQGSSSSNLPVVQSLTDTKIKSFYQEIPIASKRYAKGSYHEVDKHIRWLYRSEGTTQTTNIYEYDRVLNFNLLTGAFCPWTISSSDVKVHAIIPANLVSSVVHTEDVVDNSAVLVVDGLGNQVVAFLDSSATPGTGPFDKYLVSYPSGGSYLFTFADRVNSDYVDWFKYDGGVSFTSYFITGYKIRGAAIRKFQSNWVRIYAAIEDKTSYYFQGIWDFATQGSGTGRWSVKQLVEHPTNPGYSTVSKRIKVRGHGLALQFRVESFPEEPFEIIGWSTASTINQIP